MSSNSSDDAMRLDPALSLFRECPEDKRTMRLAWTIGVLAHLALFSVEVPRLAAARPAEPEKQPRLVLKTPRFKPPAPQPQKMLPPERARKVFIPDPTPEEIEPLRSALPIETRDDLTFSDSLSGIPPAPPSFEAEGGPLRVGGKVLKPVRIWAPAPNYTELARKVRVQGPVVLEVIIGRDGHVEEVSLLRGLPMGLSEAAVEAVRQWRFEPATLDGEPVSVLYILTIQFNLQ